MVESTASEVKDLFELQLANQSVVKATTVHQRISRLEKLREVLVTQTATIVAAAKKDYDRPETEENNQVQSVLHVIDYVIENLESWMQPEEVSSPQGSTSKIIYEPKGVVCIIGTWNSPIATCIHPLVEAIAAGNSVILKPSEVAEHYSYIIKEIIESVFERYEVAVVLGDASVSTELLKQPFHHFFYTGSPRVGKIVMEGAAKHLASVTLELGGKSPVIIEQGANLQNVAQNLVFGKIFMGGQICICPDYIFVHEQDVEALTVMYRAMTHGMLYDDNGQLREVERTTIVNNNHYKRLKNLFEDAIAKGAIVLSGGNFNDHKRLIEPTLLSNVTAEMIITQEEIFGPLTYIIPYKNIEEVFKYIAVRPKPLALYIFGQNETFYERVLQSTTSGGVTINGILLHNTNNELPFGGINNSGIGSFHGIHGFRNLSHARSVYTVQLEK